MAVSRKGLIRQLSSDDGEGYTLAAATYAVNSMHIDFNEQAYKSAKSYLEMSGFSRDGLIQQLESDAGEGFTHSQAVYGDTKVGL
jgi:Host cell surface-exposed lipoprotein